MTKFTKEQLEILESLITFRGNSDVFDIEGDFWGSVCGNVLGNVKGSVFGRVKGETND